MMRKATLLACFLVALFEGLDIQSMGVAAPRLAVAIGLNAPKLGAAMSASSVGLLVGAAVGGSLSDRAGRKAVLTMAMAILGLSSLATGFAHDLGPLLTTRLIAGLGLGGAFPTLIALTADGASPARRTAALSLIYCGLPLGGMVAGAIGGAASAWQAVFLVGGIGPLLLVPILAFILPRGSNPRPADRSLADRPAALFSERGRATLLLWLAYFLTLWVVYALLNWLPSMMASRGFATSRASSFAIVLNLGAVAGSLVLGWFADRQPRARVLIATYCGMAASLVGLALVRGGGLVPIVFTTGFFVIGGQLILYALAPILYPTARRGTGVGAAVAAGRIGSIVGPGVVGLSLALGVRAAVIPFGALPLVVSALAAALLVSAGCEG